MAAALKFVKNPQKAYSDGLSAISYKLGKLLVGDTMSPFAP
ncbi:hypothetical protein GP5015_818 [gamma proteobacterium HTCC5015]|nr:hypothetical protein GP5015_818 [gamma proteobacterium HTCC5015]